MALPASPSPSEFQPYRKVQGAAERELMAVLEGAAKAIQRRVRLLKPGVGGQVRKAQLTATLAAIRRVQASMWTGPVADAITRGVVDSQKAAESAIEAMTRVAYTGLPDAAAEALVRGLSLSAQSGIKSDAARRKRELSVRVYHDAALANDHVEKAIRQGLIQGLSAKELADDVYKYVSPTTKGGASYAAMRLARTEINNAFHERQLAGADRPGVTAVKWNLSGSHRVPDLCNEYASHGGDGHWGVGKVPEKPHPQCFCYLTYVTQKPADFQADLAAGKFDDEIDRRTRENMARLGQKVGKIEPKQERVLKAVETAKPERQKDGYLAGDWKKHTLDTEIADMAAMLEKGADPEKRERMIAKKGKDWATQTANELMAGAEDDGSVTFKNGEHRIRFTGQLDEAGQKRFLGYFDHMQTKFPSGKSMSIRVAARKEFGEGVGGETTINTGSMFINEDVMRRKAWPGMPISKDQPSALYVLAHEWGHATFPTEVARDGHVHDEAVSAGGMTTYGTFGVDGKRHPEEGIAEAFAEWTLSDGKTKNPAALVYAKKYDWAKRYGLD